jgi:hypothetical protein
VTDPLTPKASTPEPVLKAAAVWGTLATFAVSALGVLVAVGALSTEQSEGLYGVVNYVSVNFVPVASAVVGVTSLISGVAGSFATAAVGRRKVTPVAEAPVRTVTSEPSL